MVRGRFRHVTTKSKKAPLTWDLHLDISAFSPYLSLPGGFHNFLSYASRERILGKGNVIFQLDRWHYLLRDYRCLVDDRPHFYNPDVSNLHTITNAGVAVTLGFSSRPV
ncbi:hypothetical protein Zmor_014390 [Zophobas morio]|uniref:Uncharacterized protein n=1 Tax=Zophobas morio TaxID=2755281 RepID=A0AA38MGU6_9CUCU|nr:hypothetical protein Zmor_014390 [Zophobas morio]